MRIAEQCSAVPVWTAGGPFADRRVLARKRRQGAQGVVKFTAKPEIVKTGAGDREEESLVKERVEGRA
jgi:NAD(P)H-dependent flavin oxidoreductase YrpB (nitropropane dioxygenase family)